MTYFDRINQRIKDHGRLCVGLDPHAEILQAWGYPVNADGAEKMCRVVIESVSDQVAAFKPQSAFFEQFGSAGIAALERILKDIRATGAISILDVKRGDIGSTMRAYAAAYLGDEAPLQADAITLSPYCGFEALEPALELAESSNSGVYVLCRTSNPQGNQLQTSSAGSTSVAQQIVDAANQRDTTGFIGLVVGATRGQLDIDLSDFKGSILAPGIGAQGGTIEGLTSIFSNRAGQVLPSVSRSVLRAGPDKVKLAQAVASFKQED